MEVPSNVDMKCAVCAGGMRPVRGDLPFKTTDRSIIVVEDLPFFQCMNCPEHLIEDAVLERVDSILAGARGDSEIEVVGFAS